MNTLELEQEQINKAAQAVKQAGGLLICAGAGMGVDSGLPDFSGDQGFWKAYPPFEKLGYSFSDMANPDWFRKDPELAWGFYGHRLNLYRSVQPHRGFDLLLQWGRKTPGGYFVFTSNVDGHFQKADYDDLNVMECHGSIHHLQCIDPRCDSGIRPAEQLTVNVDETAMRARPPLPRCPQCGKTARPNILMFGDWNWLSQRTNDQQYRFQNWISDVSDHGGEIVIIECGAGTGVPTVRMTSENLVRGINAHLIRINLREPRVPDGQIGIAAGAMETLGLIQDGL